MLQLLNVELILITSHTYLVYNGTNDLNILSSQIFLNVVE